jgi:hypothetical protein
MRLCLHAMQKASVDDSGISQLQDAGSTFWQKRTWVVSSRKGVKRPLPVVSVRSSQVAGKKPVRFPQPWHFVFSKYNGWPQNWQSKDFNLAPMVCSEEDQAALRSPRRACINVFGPPDEGPVDPGAPCPPSSSTSQFLQLSSTCRQAGQVGEEKIVTSRKDVNDWR